MRSFALSLSVIVSACQPATPPATSPATPATSAEPQAAQSDELPPGADAAARASADACKGGTATGCLELGVAFSNGSHGLSQSEERAADQYERACELGDIRGCNNLAVMYEKGQGRAVDLERARNLYQKNCDAKHPLACRNLGRCHRDGLGTEKDPKKAAAAFASAKSLSESDCKSGVAEGCSNLGFMYQSGDEGLPKDGKRARQYLQRACDMGYKAICSRVPKP